MYDNKVRVAQDVLDKAILIAKSKGLKPTAVIVAVFRVYADLWATGQVSKEFDYLTYVQSEFFVMQVERMKSRGHQPIAIANLLQCTLPDVVAALERKDRQCQPENQQSEQSVQ